VSEAPHITPHITQAEPTVELCWHARAGQGAVTAARILAQAAIRGGKYAQAFPEFGPERSGAPVKAYNRVSVDPIRIHSPVLRPNILAVADPTLLLPGVFVGATPDACAVVNSTEPPEALAAKVLTPTLYVLDATAVDGGGLGARHPTVVMLGALAHLPGLPTLDELLLQVKEELEGRVAPAVVGANLRAVQKAFELAVCVRAEAAWSAAPVAAPSEPSAAAMPLGGTVESPGSAIGYRTGEWRTLTPILNSRCNNCLLCWFLCPDAAVVVRGGKVVGFDLDHCKGCGICAEVCPPKVKAIEMEAERR
jgi:pyruvate ferredoxin oxidoreductase gamma subunit